MKIEIVIGIVEVLKDVDLDEDRREGGGGFGRSGMRKYYKNEKKSKEKKNEDKIER